MIDSNRDQLFCLCRKSLYRECAEEWKWDEENCFRDIKKIIAENGLISLLYRILKEENSKRHFIEDADFSELTSFVKYAAFKELGNLQAIRLVNEESKKRNIKFVFFKGILLADLYPQHTERISCDSDILVSDGEKEAAEELMRDMGYEKNLHSSKNHVQVYENKKYGHIIELHTRLWEDYEGPRVEALKKLKLADSEKIILTKACGLEVYTLGYKEHLIYQIFHIIKHFSLNGVGIRYLIDVTLFVNKYFDKIDFRQFWEDIRTLGYSCFTETFFIICVDELKMTDKVFDSHPVKDIQGMDELKEDLLNVGNIMDKQAGWQIMGAMEAYFTGEASVPKSEFKRKMRMIFPSAKALPKVYDYAIKYPLLLPLAWVHRGVKFFIKKQFHKDDFYGISEKVDVGERRLRLIEELELTMKEEKE